MSVTGHSHRCTHGGPTHPAGDVLMVWAGTSYLREMQGYVGFKNNGICWFGEPRVLR